MSKTKVFKAAIYLRLSKEDGDKEESYSISNQRDLAVDYLSKHPDIKLCCEMVDDGFSGSNFDRPGFKKMIKKIDNGEINCVIVKDLSRFARDYIGAGHYLERFFPEKKVRFISINDNFDFYGDNNSNDRLIMEIKNVMNDSYIRDISIKIRSQFEIKRKKGEYIGAFTVFGYSKSKDDKHKLVVDEYAAEIVKKIFNMRIKGISASAIANLLNRLNVPSPAEYKKMSGSNFKANLQRNYKAMWSAKAVLRILKNEIYTGTLIQGTHTTANYKVKKIVEKDKSEWAVVHDNHEAIVSNFEFTTVQRLISRDTRVCPGKTETYLFSGFLECADCHSLLIRKTSKYKDKIYAYYVCSTNKMRLGCSPHNISESELYNSVLLAINTYCKSIMNNFQMIENFNLEEVTQRCIIKIDNAVEEKDAEIKSLEQTLNVVSRRFNEKIETEISFCEISNDINLEIQKIKKEINGLLEEKKNIEKNIRDSFTYINMFLENGDIKELNKTILSQMVDKILLYSDKRIEIFFNFEDKYKMLSAMYSQNKEVV